jgi:hypothetical protein
MNMDLLLIFLAVTVGIPALIFWGLLLWVAICAIPGGADDPTPYEEARDRP